MTVKDLYAEAKRITPWMVETRRALHRIPEGGFSEFKTQAFLLEQLKALGIPCETGRTWIVGRIDGAHPGPTVALRAEMDALPVAEPEGCPFRSAHEGWMHACGHDMHMSIQLAAAKMLNARKDSLRGSVRLLFQPAEETVGGAEPMVAAGVMEGVDAVYGLHVQPYLRVGQIDTRPGCLNGSTDELRIAVEGVSGHAARPEQAVDAIVCAAQLIMALQTVVSRSASPLKSAVLSLGTIHGGHRRPRAARAPQGAHSRDLRRHCRGLRRADQPRYRLRLHRPDEHARRSGAGASPRRGAAGGGRRPRQGIAQHGRRGFFLFRGKGARRILASRLRRRYACTAAAQPGFRAGRALPAHRRGPAGGAGT